MDNNEQDGARKGLNAYAKYSAMGFQMVAVIGIMSFVGYKIDQHYRHDTQWVTAIMALAGVFISLYLVIRSLKS